MFWQQPCFADQDFLPAYGVVPSRLFRQPRNRSEDWHSSTRAQIYGNIACRDLISRRPSAAPAYFTRREVRRP